MDKQRQYTEYLIYLSRCAIEKRNAEYIPNELNMLEFFNFCSFHKLENIAYIALARTEAHELDENVWLIFQDKYRQAVLNDATHGYYLDMIKDAFREHNIEYLVLKGMVMKKIYPSSDMRQVADIDIFIGEHQAQLAHDVMLELGFECTSFSELESTDNYAMDQFSQIELHRRLITDECNWKEECNCIPQRVMKVDEHEMRMSDEDFYVFMIAHMAKHAKFGGIGIRAVLDVWVYIEYFDQLDWSKIHETIIRCNLSDFHDNVLALIGYWFKDKPANAKIKQMGEYIGMSGWNGTEDQWLAGNAREDMGKGKSKLLTKLRMYKREIFWSRKRMIYKYPILNKYPFLLPFCWIHRTANALFKKQGIVKEILTKYDDADMKGARKINDFRRSIGV